ncbi:hypothetical protein K435DRAFT_640642, partial [Dendrothele bispora CBS 962.96]
AMTLLQGCRYHFDKSVSCIAHITSVIHPGMVPQFKQVCKSLVDVTDKEEFQSLVALIQAKWPGTKSWLSWWLRPEHACMIFQSQKTMAPENADHIPSATNAQESMHSKIYQIAGTGHDL